MYTYKHILNDLGDMRDIDVGDEQEMWWENENLDDHDISGWTLLARAVWIKPPTLVSWLLEKSANVKGVLKSGITALHWTVSSPAPTPAPAPVPVSTTPTTTTNNNTDAERNAAEISSSSIPLSHSSTPQGMSSVPLT